MSRDRHFPTWFLVVLWGVWIVDLILIIIGSVMMPLQQHAPWDSSGMSHFIAYMGLGLLPMLLRPGWCSTLALFVAASLFGGLMEWIQTFVPGRYGTVSDAVINMAGLASGIVAGYLLDKVVRPLLPRRGGQGRKVP